MRIRSNHWINRQRDMVNGVQSCELDLTVPDRRIELRKLARTQLVSLERLEQNEMLKLEDGKTE